jgi:hypothetical protein
VPIPKLAPRYAVIGPEVYTYVFAVNGNKVDANATPVTTPEVSGIVYNLCSFGLTKGDGAKGEVSATLKYRVFSQTY